MDRSTADPAPDLFPTRADATLFLGGFAACWVGLALIGAGAIWLGNAPWTSTIFIPLVVLELGAVILYRMGLNRLEWRITGKEPRIPFYLYVSPRTMLKALRPSTISAAAARVGLNGRLVASLMYLILALNLALLLVAGFR